MRSASEERLEHDFLRKKFPHEFLYHKNGQAVVFMSVSIREDYVEGTSDDRSAAYRSAAYIEGIFVLKSFQNQGIATELLEHAKIWAKEQELKQLASDCSLENDGS